jgi:hypothetical protein
MAMTSFFHEQSLREHFRELAAQDRQLTRWGWFRRNEHRTRRSGWRFRMGEALIHLGCWLQERGGAQTARTPGES